MSSRTLGVVLTFGGFLVAALVSVQHADQEGLDWGTINWTWYGFAFGVGLAGVIIMQMTARGATRQAHKIDADLATMDRSLAGLTAELRSFVKQRAELDVYAVAGQIDAKLMEDLSAFVEARESLITVFGLQQYASVMTLFAASERCINRAWSASVDGYIDEVHASLERASTHMHEAQSLLQELRTAEPGIPIISRPAGHS